MRISILIIFFLPFLSGCVKQVVIVSGATGRVFDAGSGRPLAGVSVVRHPPERAVVTTKEDGIFLLQPALGFRIQWPTKTLHCVTNRVEFMADGYRSRVFTNISLRGNSLPIDLKTIELQHSQK